MRNGIRSGPWSPSRPGWIWISVSRTWDIVQSLERRGLVRQVDAEGPLTYELTEAGRIIDLNKPIPGLPEGRIEEDA
jgi:hypothetical protein